MGVGHGVGAAPVVAAGVGPGTVSAVDAAASSSSSSVGSNIGGLCIGVSALGSSSVAETQRKAKWVRGNPAEVQAKFLRGPVALRPPRPVGPPGTDGEG